MDGIREQVNGNLRDLGLDLHAGRVERDGKVEATADRVGPRHAKSSLPLNLSFNFLRPTVDWSRSHLVCVACK